MCADWRTGPEEDLMRKALMSAVVFAALSLISAGHARADFWDVMECLFGGCSIGGDADIEGTPIQTQTCQAYADKAVAEAKEAQSLSCRFDHGSTTWKLDWQSHFDTCNALGGASNASATAESSRRGIRLSQCRACRDYAKRVSDLAQLANFAGCKFGPSDLDLSTDQAPHFNFCMGLGYNYPSVDPTFSQTIAVNIARREQRLQECKDAAKPQCTFCHGGSNQVSTAPPAATRKLFTSTTSSGGFDKNKSATKATVVPNAVLRDKPAAASSSAMDRLGGSSAAPASGGSYKSKDGAPTQTRSSGGAGTQSEGAAWSAPALRTSPGTGNMSTGGGEKFRAPN